MFWSTYSCSESREVSGEKMTFYRALCAGFRKRRPIGQTIFFTSIFWLVFHCFVLELWVVDEPSRQDGDFSSHPSMPENTKSVAQEQTGDVEEILVTKENPVWTYKAVNLTFWKPLRKREDGDRTGPGEGGHPVIVTKAIEEEMKQTFNINKFNLVVSNMIALDRFLPDRRVDA